MPSAYPNLPEEAGKSVKRVFQAGKEGADKGLNIAAKTMNVATAMLTTMVGEAFSLPFRALVRPTAQTVNKLAVGAVKNVVGLTWDLVKTIPFIPAPGQIRPDDASAEGGSSLASLHELSRSPLLRSGDPRRRPRTPPPRPDAESGSGGGSAVA